jgi:hypothetical protein
MITITEFHPNIQAAIRFFSGSTLSEVGSGEGVTKQAVQKRVQDAVEYLRHYRKVELVPKTDLDKADEEIQRQSTLIDHLRRELIVNAVQKWLLSFFKSKVLEFFPRFRQGALPALEKKQILDMLSKFKKAGGLLKDFARKIAISAETLTRWQQAYDKHGLCGLTPKKMRPNNFGNKIPLWIKEQLLLLFLRFPRWTPYQYHCYIRHNPVTHWYVSLPTIQKLKNIHRESSEMEKERQKKRWCFGKGTDVWTVDFTCILKTENFKLQLLTISDHRSRFLFPTALFINTSTELVVDYLEDLFMKYGKPMIVKVDNGPEFRIECKEKLKTLSVYLLNSPLYYGQFCGAHERIHRSLKTFIDDFDTHHNFMRLVDEIRSFEEQYNYKMPHDYLEGQTPANVYFDGGTFVPKNAEVVTPYQKDGELRMKFTDRDNNPARLALPIIE